MAASFIKNITIRCHFRCYLTNRLSSTSGINPDVFGTWNKAQKKTKWKLFKEKRKAKNSNAPNDFGSIAAAATDIDKNEFRQLEMEAEFISENKIEGRQLHYGDEIKKLLNEGKYQEAVDVVTVKMIQEDQIKPSSYVYNLLLGALGRLGQIKPAFKLYRQMTDRAIEPVGATYTSLFNACANSADKVEALRKAVYLREKMKKKTWIPNTTNYHSMIKAFGLCGDMKSAFELADEMMEEGHLFAPETLNFLLMACASDRQSGFLNALLLWRKFHRKGRRANLYSYNLLLRVIRDCGIGDEKKLLLESSKQNVALNFMRTAHPDNKSLQLTETDLMEVNETSDVLMTTESRLRVLGGVEGFLTHMKTSQVQPDVKTFTLLLEVCERNLESEKNLLKRLIDDKLQPDVTFFNLLIKRRIFRKDHEDALVVLDQMREFAVCPDIVTFGVLALGCNKRDKGLKLLDSIASAGFRPNIEIIGALVKSAAFAEDWFYLSQLLRVVTEEDIEVNERVLNSIEIAMEKFKKRLVDDEVLDEPRINEYQKKDFRRFGYFYKSWLEKTPMVTPPILEKVEIKKVMK